MTTESRAGNRLLGPADVAKWLGVSSGWVRDHATRKEPRLPAVKVGKLLRFRPEDVENSYRCMQGKGSIKDIQAHLRHAQPNVTADVYMQAIPESVRRAVESLDKLLMTSRPDQTSK